jgi:protein arginine kinase activator
MICEVCKRGTASFYRYVAALGKKVPVCAACMQKVSTPQKSDYYDNFQAAALDGFFSKVLMNFQPVREYYSEGDGVKTRGTVCSNCGFEFEEYYKTGRLGCVKCYDIFNAQLKPLVYKIHGCVRHNGSRPK